MLKYVAHQSSVPHPHTETPVASEWLISLCVVLIIAVCWLVLTYVWRVSLATRLLVLLTLLLFGGVGLYQLASIFSIVAIAAGLALALGLTLLQLGKKH